LWSYRGRSAGLSLTELCAALGRPAAMVAAQIAIARKALARVPGRWRIEEEWTEQRASITEPIFWLTAPHCPRPFPIRAREGVEPELVSLAELGEEFDYGQGVMFRTLHNAVKKEFPT
jgi:hypothetical protein